MDSAQGTQKVKIPVRQAVRMLLPYAGGRLRAQLQTVAFIVLYMVLFQVLIMGVPISNALEVALGVGVVILGLACFLEGLLLGIMPLGESCGLNLPARMPVFFILVFAFVLGVGATFAEPAIGFLRQAGQSLNAWQTPLLFALLNRYSLLLVLAIGGGVGIAVLFGVLRFMYNLQMRPFLLILIPLILIVTALVWHDPGMQGVVNLAWDCGAITTGPVTVPLVLALGMGISRMTAKSENRLSGFGVVALASAFPILTVMVLGAALSHQVPRPMTKEAFLAPQNRPAAESLFTDRRRINDYIGRITGSSPVLLGNPAAANHGAAFLEQNARAALQAILPLSILLVVTIVIILRQRLQRVDEILLGIGLALAGLFLFNIGMEIGLANIGRQTGTSLPAAFSSVTVDRRPTVIANFNPALVQNAITPEGHTVKFFLLDEGGRMIRVPYDPKSLIEGGSKYVYQATRGPLFTGRDEAAGYAIVLLFALLLGVSATLAEPSLQAMGLTVENLTVGTFSRRMLVRSVAAGVGIGMVVGFAKIIWSIPIIWLLVPIYALLLLLTYLSSEEFVTVAWDSAGVTTGPVTVPLVLATGVGISRQLGISEGFGVLAMASAFPILSVLLVGFRAAQRQTRVLQTYE